MNLCILFGKIISEIEFKFIIKGNNKSITYFYMELLNKSIVCIKAYDDMADLIYRKLRKKQNIIIKGEIRNNGMVECESFIVPTKKNSFQKFQ